MILTLFTITSKLTEAGGGDAPVIFLSTRQKFLGQTLRGTQYTAAQKFHRAVTAVMLKRFRSAWDSQRKHGQVRTLLKTLS